MPFVASVIPFPDHVPPMSAAVKFTAISSEHNGPAAMMVASKAELTAIVIVPVSALLLDAFALGEVISMREVVGFGIIAIGLLILSGRVPVPGLKPR